MQQLNSVTGFSELKDLLIRTYKIEKDRELIKLYFAEYKNELFMHDYSNHKNLICLCRNTKTKTPSKKLPPKAYEIVLQALNQVKPAEFLIEGFRLYGFFRS